MTPRSRLALSPGRIERREFAYRRRGILSLYAALETGTGRLHAARPQRHTRDHFVALLGRSGRLSAGRQIHIILDNVSAHTTTVGQRVSEKQPPRPISHADLLPLAPSGVSCGSAGSSQT